MDMSKFNEVLGDNSVLIVLKGQLRNIVRCVKDDGFVYYTADLRVPRAISNDVYGVTFNLLNVCFNSEFVTSNKYGDDTMKSLKDNEVLLTLTMLSKIDSYTKDGKTFKNNRCQFYVDSCQLIRTIDKPSMSKTSTYNI